MPTRTIGLVVMGAGVVLWVGLSLLAVVGVNVAGLTGAGLMAALVIIAPIGLVVIGIGAVLFIIGTRKANLEAKSAAASGRQRNILNAVQTRGSLRIGDLAVEMGQPRDTIKDDVYRLVGLGVFTGYINWDEGVLYSREASQLNDLQKCLHCGGEMTLAGKGVVQCKYCGTEYFL